jgi:hypothetical protein
MVLLLGIRVENGKTVKLRRLVLPWDARELY